MTVATAGIATTPDAGLRRILDFHLGALDLPYCGRGSDVWHTQPLDQPMAYALYLRGLVHLHRATGSSDYLHAAEVVLGTLAAVASPGTDIAWGLPFDWHGSPAWHPYTVTTSLAALALADYHATKKDTESLDLVDAACRWLIDGVDWHVSRRGAGPIYAPGFNYVATNVVAVAAGALDAGYAATGRRKLRDAADEARAYVFDLQAPQGFWTYADSDSPRAEEAQGTRVVDNLHTAYTLDGLLGYVPSRRRADRGPRAQIQLGIDFYLTQLFDSTGRGREKLVLAVSGEEEVDRAAKNPRIGIVELDARRMLLRYPYETRLWGYGAGFGLFARAYERGFMRGRRTDRILRWVLAHSASAQDGRFAFLSDDRSAFPRHEAHLFEGLAAWVAATSRTES